MEFIPPAQVKSKFFEDNPNFIEIKASDSQVLGDFEDINENTHEIWILQCKKGAKIKKLENEKIKFPGCTKFSEKYQAETIKSRNIKRATFGYATRKHHYAMKSLPIAGEILISDQIEESDIKTPEPIVADHEETPLPESIKIRHPLLGAKFDKFLKIDDNIQKRLNGYDDSSNYLKTPIKAEKSPKKRKHLPAEDTGKIKLAKIVKTESPDLLEVGEDLKWIKQI